MADKDPNKDPSSVTIFLVVLVLISAVAGYWFATSYQKSGAPPVPAVVETEEPPVDDEVAEAEEVAPEDSAEQIVDTREAVVTEEAETVVSGPVLGDRNAPIRIEEFSSFTCGHCGRFHKDVFGAFKEQFIDTGKAYLVFSDFPLNGPALQASIVSRCVPEDQYFDFVQMLFEEQERWAFERDFTDKLKERAARYGVPGEKFYECANNRDVQREIIRKVEASQTLWDIQATPTFIINNRDKIQGALNLEQFVAQINAVVPEEHALKLAAPVETEGSGQYVQEVSPVVAPAEVESSDVEGSPETSEKPGDDIEVLDTAPDNVATEMPVTPEEAPAQP